MRTETACWQRGVVGVTQGHLNAERGKNVSVRIPLSLPYLVAAIDPRAEAKPVGLNGAITEGRYLEDAESWKPVDGIGAGGPGPVRQDKQVPILMASRTFATGSDEIKVSDLGAPGVAAMTKVLEAAPLRTALLAQHGTPVGADSITAAKAFDELPGIQPAGVQPDELYDYFGDLWTARAPELRATGPRSVGVAAKTLDPKTLDYSGFSSLFLPGVESLDVPFRDVAHHAGNSEGKAGDKYFNIPQWQVVGRYDPTKVSQGSDLASVPLSLYSPRGLTGADAGRRPPSRTVSSHPTAACSATRRSRR